MCLGSHNLNCSNRPVRTRMPGGVGGERSGILAAPIPIVVLGGSRSSRHKEQLAEHVQVATRISLAFSGNAYVQQIVMGEVSEFVQRYRSPGRSGN